MSRSQLTTIVATLLIGVSAATAEDVVFIITGADGKGRTRVTGEIVDYNGDELRIRLLSGRVNQFAADRVAEIQTSWTEPHKTADQLFAQGNFVDALTQYRQAQATDQRPWVARKLQAQKVWCARSLGNFEQACVDFLKLAEVDPTNQYFAAIPLSWTTQQPTRSLESQARSWMESDLPVAALIGASWLLPVQRGPALAVLQRLTSDKDARVAHLASAQIWTSQVVTASDGDLTRWQAQINRMPSDLRAGPYFTLGRALAYQKQHESAAIALLRLPIQFPRERQLAARALYVAAGELESLGRRDEALSLYQELLTKHADDPAAAEAQGRVEKLTEK